ncbi:DUF4442 domain-containing protein [Saxibacter everestensis]|uniref:DUF4442 domain-containing protein n=1 Tax=Saxibacter everestensis TaxID=2909229 RepID=A0ABY8QXR0_9MICO|nr:DUF4442 domain-containing protein [Brevibacteriaceae bacterium ZFBP1038]
MQISSRRLKRLMNVWPPFIGAGIRVQSISDDFTSALVRMRLTKLNRNYVGTHFGGSLSAMTDPFFMMLALQQFGRDYVVWDKAAEIEFVAPGRSTVYAHFELPASAVNEIRQATEDGSKALPWFDVDITAEDGSMIARVRRQLYVRRKPARVGQSVF